ncbi:MFS transporter [Actinomadura kijaniata]|uniref:MFS transporter n=1 Tax=Actinomadura kijaniata TaxID=46161 RepID=UPI00082E935D|nr:MFS transporter [Actinomadura kijaniata]
MTIALPLAVPVPVAGPVRSRWALPLLLSAVFMTTLDFFIVNVALPSARRDLGLGPSLTQLTAASYGLAYAAFLVVAGRLGDRYGRRRVFGIGLALFTAASAACGLAPTGAALVAARTAQGVAAALLAPQVLALLGTLYPGAERTRAFGWYGTAVGLAGVSGQALGGLLIATGPGWRTCFLVNVPVGLAALLGLRRAVPESFGTARPLDLPGAALLAAGLALAVLPFTAPEWWPVALLAAPALAAFAVRQRRVADPLLELALLRDGGFAAGLAAVALLFATSAGLSFALSLALQDRHGLSPLTAGLIFTALNAGFVLAAPLARRLPERRAPALGALVLASGLALLPAADDPFHLPPGLLLAGAGMGLTMAPLISTALARVAPGSSGQASGLLGTVQELGGVLGVAATGTALSAPGHGLAVPLALALALLVLVLRVNGRTAVRV